MLDTVMLCASLNILNNFLLGQSPKIQNYSESGFIVHHTVYQLLILIQKQN